MLAYYQPQHYMYMIRGRVELCTLLCIFVGSSRLIQKYHSGVTVQDALRENSIETTEENLLELKYDPESVWGYIAVLANRISLK